MAFGTSLPARIPQSTGTQYYVAPSGGSNANNGTSTSTPWATLQHALNTVPLNGSIINLRGGDHGTSGASADPLTIFWNRTGNSANPITVRSYPGESAVITGARILVQGSNPGSYIRFSDFEMTGGWDCIKIESNAHHIEIDKMRLHHPIWQPILIGGSGIPATDIQIWNTKIWEAGAHGDPDQHGIYVASGDRIVIANCLIYTYDCYGIHLYPDTREVIVTACTVDQTDGEDGGPIVFDSDSMNVRVEACILTRSVSGYEAIRMWRGVLPTSVVADCVASNVTAPAFPTTTRGGSPWGGTYINNTVADPLFVNLAARDYKLQTGSPAINRGSARDVWIPATDIDGTPRVTADAGAYAYIAAGTPTSISRDVRITGGTSTTRRAQVTFSEIALEPASSSFTVPITVFLGNLDFTVRDIRISGATPASIVPRDIRIIGKASLDISRDLRVVGTATLTDTSRDLRMIGQAPVTSETTRDIRINGTSPISTEVSRDIQITGFAGRRVRVTWTEIQIPPAQILPNETVRDIRIRGQLTSEISRDLRITGIAETTRDIRIRGQNSDFTARDLRISGIQTGADNNVSRDIRISGGLPWVGVTVTYRSAILEDNVTRDIRISGRLDTNDIRDLRIRGQADQNVNRDLRIIGQLSSSVDRDLRTLGQVQTFSVRDLRITGTSDIFRSHEIRITGRADALITRDIRIIGTATTNASRDLKTRGQIDSLATRDLRITGRLSSDVSRDVKLSGQADNSIARDIKVESVGTAHIARDLYLIGYEQNSIEGELKTFGEVAVSASFDLRIKGGLITTSSGYDLRVFGEIHVSDSRDLRIEGDPAAYTFIDRDIRIEGRQVEVARPDGVISNEGWIPIPGGTLDSTIDEIIPDESDYMKSPTEPSEPKPVEVSLTDVTAPLLDKFHTVRYRIAASQSPSRLKFKVILLQGATEIASWEHENLSSQPDTFAHELTEQQAGIITDYTDLRLRFIVSPPEITRYIRITGTNDSSVTREIHLFAHEAISRDIRVSGEATDNWVMEATG